jgi:hypothetical protein
MCFFTGALVFHEKPRPLELMGSALIVVVTLSCSVMEHRARAARAAHRVGAAGVDTRGDGRGEEVELLAAHHHSFSSSSNSSSRLLGSRA